MSDYICSNIRKTIKQQAGPDYSSPRPAYWSPGRNIPSWAGTQQARPEYPSLGRHISAIPGGPGSFHPGWAFPWLGRDSLPRLGWRALPRLGRLAAPGRPGAPLPPGWARSVAPRPPPAPAGPAGRCPGWAFQPAPRWAGFLISRLGCCPGQAPRPARPGGLLLVQTRLGRIRRIRPGRDFPPGRHTLAPAGPDYNTPAGPL
jgi:hypothetical protein